MKQKDNSDESNNLLTHFHLLLSLFNLYKHEETVAS
jgi:hypothetical protein